MTAWSILETDEGVQFKIKVQPRSAKNEIKGLHGDAVKIKLTAPPVDGEANLACVRYLADMLGISQGRIRIVSGHTGRQKIISVEGFTREGVIARLKLGDI